MMSERPGGQRSSTGGSGAQRLPGLDGLRAVAVTVVLLVHADLLPGGFIGVDLFFVLSGFLITTLMVTEIDRTGRLDLVGFWSRRSFRLVPAVLAYLTAGVALAAATKPDVLPNVAENALAVLAGVFNYVYPLSGGSTSWDGHLWSLSVEAQFYVFWPLVVVLALRTGRRRALLAAGAVVVLVLGLWRACVGVGLVPYHDDWYHSTDTRVDAFVVGALLAWAIHLGVLHARTGRMRGFWLVATPAAWGILAAVTALSPRLDDNPRWAYLGGLSVVSLTCAVIVGASVLCPGGWSSRLMQTGPLEYVGRHSYAFYLWHFPVVFALEPLLDARVTRYGTAVAAFVVSLVLARLSMVVVERPAARLRPVVERLRVVAELRHRPALNPGVQPEAVGARGRLVHPST